VTPAAFLGYADGDDFVLFLVNGLEDGGGGKQRNFVFAAAPAEKNAYPDFCHEKGCFPQSE
jgi:hypothetical protein